MHPFAKAASKRTHSHKVLGVRHDASREEIKAAYKKLALAWHPDRHMEDKNQATARFIEIKNAYIILMHEMSMSMSINTEDLKHSTSRLSAENTPVASTPTRPPLRRAGNSYTGSTLPVERERTARPTSSPLHTPIHTTLPLPVDNPPPTPTRPPTPPRPPLATKSTSSTTIESMPSSSRKSSIESLTTPPSSPSFSFKNVETISNPTPTTPSIIDILNKSSPPLSVTTSMASRRCEPVSATGSKDSRTRASEPLLKPPVTPLPETPPPLPEKSESQSPSHYDHLSTYGPLFSSQSFGSKEWHYTLTLTLEELFHGKMHRFLITRHLLNGSSMDVVLEVDVPPGCEAGRKIIFRSVGHEYHPYKLQDIIFVVGQADHDRFSRIDHDLVMECETPWTETLKRQDGKLCFPGIDGQVLSIKVSCLKKRPPWGAEVIAGAGMPILHDDCVVGRGNLIVNWKVDFPKRRSRWNVLKAVLRWARRK
ncbi:hypothetical protein D9758_013103 [Tetrapyrgos nigripes]|uniref:J domain-containing protein n=1 Tax=Tetrapyrgos nigripes TaxID=182062 RepID=A0A8H5CA26_9AGAR|nr:hypothetical protein D9758_013103 [Tetrapyrgos nigripes]